MGGNLKKDFEHLGQFLKVARAESGLTQQDIADKVGVHTQYISNWERGLCALHAIALIRSSNAEA
jgi:transcriptional regulator with XRE-family HTH domain